MDFHFSWLKNSCTGICPGNCENIGWMESIFCVNAHMIKYCLAQYFQKSTLVTIPLSEKFRLELSFPNSWEQYWNIVETKCALCVQQLFHSAPDLSPFDLYFPLGTSNGRFSSCEFHLVEKFQLRNLPRKNHEIIGCTNSIFLCKCAHD